MSTENQCHELDEAARRLGREPSAAAIWGAYDLAWQATTADVSPQPDAAHRWAVTLGGLMDAYGPLDELVPRNLPGPAADSVRPADTPALRAALVRLLRATATAVRDLPAPTATAVNARVQATSALTEAAEAWR